MPSKLQKMHDTIYLCVRGMCKIGLMREGGGTSATDVGSCKPASSLILHTCQGGPSDVENQRGMELTNKYSHQVEENDLPSSEESGRYMAL